MSRENKTLVTKDVKGSIRYAIVTLNEYEDRFEIERVTGLLRGKPSKQPTLKIREGKQKRTREEQAMLEYASCINAFEDKGYKHLVGHELKDLTVEIYNELFGVTKTDANGNIKPMLAKAYDALKPETLDRHWFASAKLDGTRCLLYWDAESEQIKTASRGGKDYNAATKHIRENGRLIALFKKNPKLILDGELYKHGTNLEKISGLVRLKEWTKECEILEYHCYDFVDVHNTFQRRLEFLDRLRDWLKDEPKLNVLEHFPVYGYNEAKALHDKWVAQGYEGAVLRDPTKVYIPGGRTVAMIKLKEFKDDEFEIIGYTPGLRGAEDMVFNLKTKAGVEFEAKPMGSKELKERYVEDFENIKGKKGTVKYFYMTPEGKPFLPVFKAIRNYE
jgi:DNA ligase-1